MINRMKIEQNIESKRKGPTERMCPLTENADEILKIIKRPNERIQTCFAP